MSIASVSAAASSAATVDKATIADDFDIFLKLLTVQLKNQDPLEPLKTSEFTQQMVQFTQVEQQVKSNKNLENLIRMSQQAAFTSNVNYIGKTVLAEGDTTSLKGGAANWDVNFDETPEENSVVITNTVGKVVFSGITDFKIGSNSFSWDGKNNGGQDQPEGLYTIKINATNADGELIGANTLISGTVTGVDMTGEYGMLLLGDRSVKIENVRKIEA